VPWKAADFHAEHPPARSPSVKLLRRLHAADAIDGQLSGFSDTRAYLRMATEGPDSEVVPLPVELR